MLDNITKYINLPDNGIAGQDARTKEWYCKELPFHDSDDLDKKISKINKVLNKYNKEDAKKRNPSPPHNVASSPPSSSNKDNKVRI